MKSKGLMFNLAALTILICGTISARAYADGAAYTMTNNADDNQIVMFSRDTDGLLTKLSNVSTGGKGSGGGIDPLASQGSLVLTEQDPQRGWIRHAHGHHKTLLLAVNAGSNDVSVFHLHGKDITLQDRLGSGGSFPVSVTVSNNLVYVLNNGTPANISGFRLDGKGRLHAVPHSIRLLGEGNYSQVAFDPIGAKLIVTDKANQRILVYAIGKHGMPAITPAISASSGAVPFGVDFDRKGHLLVVEAGTNAVSSYAINDDGSLQTISASIPNGQIATCWIVVNKHGDIVTTNPGTNSLSAFHVDATTGQVSLLNGTAGAVNAPLDIDMSRNGRYAYAVDPVAGGVDMFRVESDGSLTTLGVVDAGLAIYAQGMAVR